MIAELAGAFFQALLGQLVAAFNDWRRDKALTDLGYNKAQIVALDSWKARLAAAVAIRAAARAGGLSVVDPDRRD